MPLSTLGTLNPPDSLTIFDRFEVDDSLAKNYKPETPVSQFFGVSISSGGPFDGTDSVPWYKRLFSKKEKSVPPAQIKQVFERILLNAEELKVFEDRENKVLELRERAVQAGQSSLIKKIDEESEVRKLENTLFALGLKRYISEQQLLQFAEKADKGLCLDWIKHFVRPIPKEVVDAKVRCDELRLFDNYAVLHYDPENKATLKIDREALKDPILFGLIKGSRKLYFVGDWMDEQCDLTFQQIIDKLGSKLEME